MFVRKFITSFPNFFPNDLLPNNIIIILMVKQICCIFLINLSLQHPLSLSSKLFDSTTTYAMSCMIGFYSVLVFEGERAGHARWELKVSN
jgi:hypothetical protein